jgi:hypothetical protein
MSQSARVVLRSEWEACTWEVSRVVGALSPAGCLAVVTRSAAQRSENA